MIARVCAIGLAAWVAAGLAPAAGAQVSLDQTPWEQLLRQRVRRGLVDYAGLKANPEPLDRYLRALQYIDPHRLETTEEQLALWINAYNACVIKGVLDHYPLKSVKDVNRFFDGLRYQVAGEALTLNQLEGKGRSLGDWRLHFALVCAASSCPPLRTEAYVPDRLDRQLTEQVTQFLREPERGLRVDEGRRILWVSKIFTWYAKDFVRRGPLTSETLLAVVHRYVDPEVLERAQRRPMALNFLEYDWTLNDQAGMASE